MTTAEHPQKSWLIGWSTRDLMVTAVIGIVFGLLTVPVHLLMTSVEMLAGPIGSRIFAGVFFIPGLITPYIIRKPGVSIVATLISLLVQAPINPYGWAIVVTIITNGIPIELAFLITRYKQYSLAMMLISGALVVVPGYLGHALSFGYLNLQPMIVIGGLIMAMISTALLGGWLSKALADAITQTGVLSGFAIAEAHQEEI